ncbi:hypothetical protein [Chryseobacterium panacisoli]|uniref:hypothetical protein n=1 Tax=Chryseobacterium panacisoli TaxID=1807141 RepID=UPI001E527349|nr:hypothetical protein [Chryseobacterium panacisoli]
MKKIYIGAFTLCTVLGISAQEVVWQKDIKSSTQDFLSQVTTTIDQQYLITGNLIQSDKLPESRKYSVLLGMERIMFPNLISCMHSIREFPYFICVGL